MDAVEWLPWGRVRMTERGAETAFHHPLIAIRLKGDLRVKVVNPGDLVGRAAGLDIDSWRPMAWAQAGRRGWQALDDLGPNSVFHGADVHLFHCINAVCEQLFEGGLLDPDGAERWRSVLRRRVAWCGARNIVYRHLIVPEHHAVYADKIPDSPALSEERPLACILRGLEPHVRDAIVYPLERMIAGRARFDTSMRHDVHFTRYGCFLCYQTLLETLTHIDAAEIIREADLREREIFVAGDVAHAAGERCRSVRFHEPPAVEHRSILKGTSYKTYQVDVQVSEAPSGRRLVIFRTSNSTHLIPFLLRHFSRITAVATLRVFYDLIESEQPHVVISEMPERYLAVENLSADSHALNAFAPDDDGKFEEETGHSLPLPEE